MKTIYKYFCFILNRAISGIINGLFYAGAANFAWVIIGLFILGTGYFLIHNLSLNWSEMNQLNKWLSIAGIFVSLVSIVFVGLSFKFPKWRLSEIHFWTWANQTAISGTLFFSAKRSLRQIWWLILSVSPAAFLQKFFINVCSGLPWNYIGTDVSSGKFWTMKLFGKIIKVPRIANMKIKLLIAVICIIAFIIIQHKEKVKMA